MKNKKKIRQNFRESVFKRDGECKVCGTKIDGDNMDAHHITDRNEIVNGGYVAENGITVCKDECHMKVEEFHISGGENWYDGLHPDDLYRLIGSSKDLAIEKSKRLK